MIWHWPTPSNWAWRAALITATVFALSLLYVVPLAVLLRAQANLRRQLIDEAKQGRIVWPQPVPESPEPERNQQHTAAVINLLHRRQVAFRCLLRAERPLRAASPAAAFS